MKNLITYLKTLWGACGNLQSKDISLDRRLTVGSPSGLDAKWMLKLVSVLVLILTIGSGNVWGDVVCYTLTPASGSNNSYTGNCDVAVEDEDNDLTVTWNLVGNSQTTCWRIGGKRLTSATTRTLYSKTTAIPDNVTKIEIDLGTISSQLTCSKCSLVVSTAANAGGTQTSKLSITSGITANNTITFTRPDGKDWSSKYYKFMFDITTDNTNSNRYLEICEIRFYKAASSKTLSSIAITTAPTTTKYLNGETFSKTGAVVTATYSDATTADVSSSATWNKTTLSTSDTKVTASYTEGGVTKTADQSINVYSVTVQKKDESGTTIADAGVSASATGRTLTASAGSTHYVFKTWKYGTASGTSIASATSASTSLTGTPSAAVTVIAEFYKPCTVTWSVNGSTSTISATTNVSYNSTVSMPTPSIPMDCTGSTFMGWTTAANASYSGDSAPSPLYNTTSPAITGDVTFYAVFADED